MPSRLGRQNKNHRDCCKVKYPSGMQPAAAQEFVVLQPHSQDRATTPRPQQSPPYSPSSLQHPPEHSSFLQPQTGQTPCVQPTNTGYQRGLEVGVPGLQTEGLKEKGRDGNETMPEAGQRSQQTRAAASQIGVRSQGSYPRARVSWRWEF